MEMQERLHKRNRRVAFVVLFVAVGMVGMSYAAVPLYQIFCQVTGYDGTTQKAEVASDTVIDREIRVRFDSNVTNDLNWDFKPKTRVVDIKLGENKLVYYTAQNVSKETVTGVAKFKVTPEIMGSYFNKIECFCFTEQKLEPGQKVEMPVSFFVDPEMIKDADAKGIQEITLSYTFYPAQPKVSKAEDVSQGKGKKSADL